MTQNYLPGNGKFMNRYQGNVFSHCEHSATLKYSFLKALSFQLFIMLFEIFSRQINVLVFDQYDIREEYTQLQDSLAVCAEGRTTIAGE